MSFTPQTLSVPKGGTGAVTFTDAGVLIGNGTGAVQVTGAGTSGQVLTSNGAGVDPTFQAIPTAAPVGAQYVTLATDATLTSERVLTGTATQIIITDNGAGSTVVISVGTELAGLAGLSANGIPARTGAGTYSSRTITGTANQITMTNGDGVAGNPTIAIASNPILPGTGSQTVPIGATAQRPGSPVEGMMRYNSDTDNFEGYVASAWQSIFSGAGGIRVVSVPVVFGDIAVAALTTDIALHSVPTNSHIIAAAIETTTEGDVVASLNLSAGWFSAVDTIGNYDGLTPAPNAATSTNGNTFLPVQRDLRFYATSTVSNLDQMTQGRWVVHLSYITY